MNDRGTDLYRALIRIIYLVAGLVVLFWFLIQIEIVLLATILALILALALNVPVRWLEDRNVPRGAGTAITFFALLGITVAVGRIVVPRLAEEIPTLIEQIPELVENLAQQVAAIAGDHPEVQRQVSRLVDWMLGVVEGLWQYADVLLGGIVLVLFVTALFLYMVTNMRPMLRWYIRSMPPHLREPAAKAFSRASTMVAGWVVASVILGGIKAVAATVFLLAMDVPGAIIWGTLAFFGAFVPQVGFYLMTIPPVIVSFTVSPLVALWTFLFYLAFSELLGKFVAPRIYAETMDLNAVFVLFMTLAMGFAFGVIGVLIAAPVAGFLKAFYDEFYLARQPAGDDLDAQVESIVTRKAH